MAAAGTAAGSARQQTHTSVQGRMRTRSAHRHLGESSVCSYLGMGWAACAQHIFGATRRRRQKQPGKQQHIHSNGRDASCMCSAHVCLPHLHVVQICDALLVLLCCAVQMSPFEQAAVQIAQQQQQQQPEQPASTQPEQRQQQQDTDSLLSSTRLMVHSRSSPAAPGTSASAAAVEGPSTPTSPAGSSSPAALAAVSSRSSLDLAHKSSVDLAHRWACSPVAGCVVSV
jgi:hypothetical protein